MGFLGDFRVLIEFSLQGWGTGNGNSQSADICFRTLTYSGFVIISNLHHSGF